MENNSSRPLIVFIAILLIVIVVLVSGFGINLQTLNTYTSTTSVEDVLGVHKEVLETVKWIVTIFVGLLTASGVASLIYGIKGISDIQAQVEKLKESMGKTQTDAQAQVEKLKESMGKTQTDAQAQVEKLKESMGKTQSDVRSQVKKLKKTVRSVSTEAEKLQKETNKIKKQQEDWLPLLRTIYEVNRLAVKLWDGEDQMQMVTETLIQFSHDPNPAVRRECVRTFSEIPDYAELKIDINLTPILERLKTMASKDTMPIVQLDAQRALRKFGVEPES